MPDVPKRLEKAEKLLRKQHPDQAAAELQALLTEFPDDDELLGMVVELLLAFDLKARAVDFLGQRFERRARQQRLADAEKLFRQLQQHQAQPGGRFLTLAQLHERQKQTREAESLYRQAAGVFRAAGNKEQELVAWREVLRLNPRDFSTCLEVANRAEAAGDAAFAGQVLAAAAELSQDDYRLLERAVKLLPDRKDVRLRYARALLRGGPLLGGAAMRALEPLRGEAGDAEVAGALADALLLNDRAQEARELIEARLAAAALPGFAPEPTPAAEGGAQEGAAAGALDPSWLERGLRCLRLLARAGDANAGEFAVALEAHANPEQAAWRIALDAALADAHEHQLLLYLAGAFERTGQTPKMISALYQSLDLAISERHHEIAAERLSRILAADAFDAAAPDRLELLRGHIPESEWMDLSGRIGRREAGAAEDEEAVEAEAGNGTSLDDLILQAEIFLQYQLMPQARERARAIARLYPGQQAANERLAKLYEMTGLPAPAGAPAPAAVTRPAVGPAASFAPPAPAPEPPIDVGPVVRAVHRESTPRRVFLAAVNQIGQAWRADRCLAAQFNAGQPPSNVVEYCAAELTPSDPAFVARLLTLVEAHIPAAAPRWLALPRANETAQIAQTLRRMGIETLISHPLEEGGAVTGVMLLAFCAAERVWTRRDAEALATVGDQVVMALANTRLRGLLRQFTESDERTGLLRISSLLEVLVAECARAQEQRAKATVMCLELLRPPAALQAPENREWLERVAQKLTAYLRPNDSAASPRPNQFLIVMPDTVALNCAAIFQKLRLALADFVWPDGRELEISAGAAEIAADPQLAPEDIATDLLDRALRALTLHRAAPRQPIRVAAASPLVAIAGA